MDSTSFVASNRPRTKSEQVYESIKDLIAQGETRSDHWLRQRALASQLNVSVTPVVKAFHQLEQEGVLEVIPQWGARVRTYSPDELEQLFNIRIAMACLVARRLAERAWELESDLQALRPLAVRTDELEKARLANPQRTRRPRDQPLAVTVNFTKPWRRCRAWTSSLKKSNGCT